MSKIEKRILVLEVNPDCKALKFSGDPFDNDDGMYCDKSGKWVRITEKDCAKCKSPVLTGITRAEAVERMAKAMCALFVKDGDCGWCPIIEDSIECKAQLEEDFKKPAKAALDALLGKEANKGK